MQAIKNWLASLDFAKLLGAITGYLWRGLRAVGASLKAFALAPQTWISGALCVVAGFCIGYWQMQQKVVRLDETAASLSKRYKAAAASLETEKAHSKKLADELKAAQDKAAPAAPVAAPADVPAAAAQPKVRKVKAAAPAAPASSSFWPFQ